MRLRPKVRRLEVRRVRGRRPESGMDLLCIAMTLLFFAACELFVARVADRL